MPGFVVVVDFRLRPGQAETFRELIVANARASVRDEPGCRQFDVVAPSGEPDRVYLYEIYEDRSAFDAHLASSHYAAFDRASAAMVASKQVMFGNLSYAGADG